MRSTRLVCAVRGVMRKLYEPLGKLNRQYGFTLIELLAAAAIIGVLVTLAMPRYLSFVAKSRQAEAKNNLGTIHKLQEAYYLDQAALKTSGAYHSTLDYGVGKCGSSNTQGGNTLGFRLSDCSNARYFYTTTASNISNAASVHASAKIYPGCSKDDRWTMSATGQLSQPTGGDVLELCSN